MPPNTYLKGLGSRPVSTGRPLHSSSPPTQGGASASSYAAIISCLKVLLKGPPRALKAPQREPSRFLTLRYTPEASPRISMSTWFRGRLVDVDATEPDTLTYKVSFVSETRKISRRSGEADFPNFLDLGKSQGFRTRRFSSFRKSRKIQAHGIS